MPTTTPFNNLITFSRGSNATVTGSNGLIQWAPNNLVTFSEQFNNAAWTKTNATVYANQDIPGGTLGPEIVVNGDFSSGFGTGWADASTGTGSASISGGQASVTSNTSANPGYVVQSITTVVGRSYLLTWQVVSGASAQVRVGTSSTGTQNAQITNASIVSSAVFVATATTTFVTLANNNSITTSTYDNISVKEIIPAAATAPDGTQTADTLIEAAVSGEHAVNVTTSISIPAGTSTFSTYLKAGGRDWVVLNFAVASGSLSTSDARAWFNLTTGVVGTTASGAVASITPVGSGWYRCSITATFGSTANRRPYVALADADGSYSYAGNGTGSVLIWGAQLELGSTATTYNPTSVKNLLGFSEAFDNAAWTKISASIVTGAQANPVNGLFNAQKLMEDTSSAGHQATQSVTTTANPFTYSVYAKAAGRSWVALGITDSTSTVRITYFDLANGVLGTVATGITASITPVGNGWYRCAVTVAASLAGSTTCRVYLASANNTTSYTGDGNSGVYIYGAQLSDSASLDPYVPTPAAAPSSTAYYGPRFDYDPVTLQPRGILIEEQRTNLLLRSEEFDNAYWSKFNATVTADAGSAPDGTTTADALFETIANNSHSVFRGSSIVSGGTYTVSAYVKANGRTRGRLTFTRGVSPFDGFEVIFDLVSETATGAPIATGTITNSGIVSVGDGWYRVFGTGIAGTFTSANAQIQTNNDAGAPTYVGDPTKGLLIWGAQLEAATFATSYIPTVASTVTRSADVVTITGQNFAQWYAQPQGTFVLDGSSFGIGANTPNFLLASNGSASDYIRMNGASGYTNRLLVQSGGVQYANLNAGSGLVSETPAKVAAAYAVNSFQSAANAVLGGGDTSGDVPVGANQILFGSFFASTGTYLNGHIRNIRFIPERAADFQLQVLTTRPIVDYFYLQTATGDQLVDGNGDYLYSQPIFG